MGNEPAPPRGLGCGHMRLRASWSKRIFFPPNHHQHFPPQLLSVRSRLVFHTQATVDLVNPINSENAKGCETWLVPVDVSIVAAVRGVFVLLPWLCLRRVPCVQTHVPTTFPLPSFLSSVVRC